ncbi:unnamed protein product [Vicia faba]|uniref:Uncharacterized protein n=1 Tax=Vicia faba TaxID=3906 RepID=A0AAV1AD30_VICFA|nr:unnamed protein product [Vicia faba]
MMYFRLREHEYFRAQTIPHLSMIVRALVLHLSDYYDSERLLMSYKDDGTSSRDYSFDVILFDDDIEKDHKATSLSHSSGAMGASTSPALSTSKMQTVRLRIKHVRDFIQMYQITYNQDPTMLTSRTIWSTRELLYEEGFSHEEVLSSLKRKNLIDICIVMSGITPYFVGQTVTPPLTTYAPSFIVEAIATAFKVGQLTTVVVALFMEE